MRHVWNFFTGLFLCLLFLVACGPDPADAVKSSGLEPAQASIVSYNLYDIVRLILATFGGVATTILLTYLKSKYPKYFGTLKIPADPDQSAK